MVKAWLRAALAVAWLVALLGTFACAEQRYVVRPGDTLSALARRFDTSVVALAAANGLSGDLLRVGQVLQVPDGQEGGYHVAFVRQGETLADLAARVGRSAVTLASANPGLARFGLRAGAMVSVPPADGVTVEVGPGDTLATLAARGGLSVGALAALNHLSVHASLQPGASILLPADAPLRAGASGAGGAGREGDAAGVPGVGGPDGPSGKVPAGVPPAPAAPPVEGSLTARQRLRRMQDRALSAAVAHLPEVSFSADTFVAPVQGRVSSRFGWRALSVNGNHYHAGVDLAAPMGTPVHAARDGTVVKAGWGGTYGNVVYLDHGDGTQTRYAHLSRIDARVGQGVRQGDVLGLVGSTGASTGPHVHFELRFDGRAVDPLAYLHGLATR